MKQLIKKIVSPIYSPIKKTVELNKFKNKLSENKNNNKPLKIVVGSSSIFENEWIPSEVHFLDLLDEKTWNQFFKKDEITYLLAEHVWEHLTEEEGKIAAKNCYKYLKKGGNLRVAIPDGYHPNSDYIDYVKPGGHGPGADDHKVLYTYKTFSKIFEEAGFVVKPLEYFNEKKEFQFNDWEIEKGYIHRSIKNDKRNINGEPNYTSIIIDAQKK